MKSPFKKKRLKIARVSIIVWRIKLKNTRKIEIKNEIKKKPRRHIQLNKKKYLCINSGLLWQYRKDILKRDKVVYTINKIAH